LTCGADVGFIYHLAILVNADTDTLVKAIRANRSTLKSVTSTTWRDLLTNC
jgi:hypothetical protein